MIYSNEQQTIYGRAYSTLKLILGATEKNIIFANTSSDVICVLYQKPKILAARYFFPTCGE